MLPISKDEFLELLRRNSLLSGQQLDRVTRELNTVESTKELAAILVYNDLISEWQAKQLLSGNKIQELGRYQLVDCLANDGFGLSFLAVHKDLDRNAVIHVLPDKISDEVFEETKQKLSQIASLDHPNIVHCLDIDQFDGKFVVIDEHLKGGVLSEANLKELNEFDVAKIVRQCLAGLKFAHERNVIHGDLNRSNIMINMGNLKIRDFALVNLKRLVHPGGEAVPDSRTDLFDLAEIGLELLDEIPGDDSENRMKLMRIISDLETGSVTDADRVMDRLDRWIETNCDKEKTGLNPGSNEIANKTDSKFDSSTGNDETSFSMRNASPLHKYRPKRKRWSPFVVYSLILAGFAVACLCLLVYWKFSTTSRTKAETQGAPVANNSNANSRSTENAPTSTSGSTSETNRVRLPRVVDQPAVTTSDNSRDSLNPLDDKSNAHSRPDDLPATDEPLPDDSAPGLPDVPVTNALPTTNLPITKLPSTNPTVTKRPFQDFPKHFELPAIDNVKSTKISDLVINQRFLLGAKLFSTTQATRNSGLFELRRSDDDKQRWIVSKRKSAKTQPVDIATFRKTDSEMYFGWLPAAQLDEEANYLRNAAPKLETPDGQSAWLNLRSPVTIDRFKLTDNESSVKLKVELPWMPNPKGLVIEIAPFRDQEIPSLCVPEYVQEKTPALMYFTRDEAKAFIWLEVSADRRSTISLVAELKINAMGNILALNPAMLSEYRQAVVKIAQNAGNLPGATNQADKGTKKRSTAVRNAAAKTVEAFVEYERIIPGIYGKDIPVAIYFTVEDHQFLIAKTPGFVNF